jgi:hypothetical protein
VRRAQRGLKLVCVPICEADWAKYDSSSNVDIGVGGTFFDRSGGNNFAAVTLDAVSKWVMFTLIVHGPVVGLRVQRPFTGAEFLDVLIDGVAYRIDGRVHPTNPTVTTKPTDNWANIVLANNLPEDKEHVLQVCFAGAAGVTRTWNWFGLLLSERAGHGDNPQRGSFIVSLPKLTQAAVTLAAAGGTNLRPVRRLHQIIYTNTHTAEVTVYLRRAGGGLVWSDTLTAAGTKGSSAIVPLEGGDKTANLSHDATVAAVVDAALFCGY